jgi:hypothetical protein
VIAAVGAGAAEPKLSRRLPDVLHPPNASVVLHIAAISVNCRHFCRNCAMNNPSVITDIPQLQTWHHLFHLPGSDKLHHKIKA